MEVMSSSSRLNPHAAPFVPGAYRVVEDYSPEWWSMLEFRDYWLRGCFYDEDEVVDVSESVLPDADSLFHSYPLYSKEEEVKLPNSSGWELIGWERGPWGPNILRRHPNL